MSRPRRIPSRGDVAASLVAELLGLSVSDFEVRRAALRPGFGTICTAANGLKPKRPHFAAWAPIAAPSNDGVIRNLDPTH